MGKIYKDKGLITQDNQAIWLRLMIQKTHLTQLTLTSRIQFIMTTLDLKMVERRS